MIPIIVFINVNKIFIKSYQTILYNVELVVQNIFSIIHYIVMTHINVYHHVKKLQIINIY